MEQIPAYANAMVGGVPLVVVVLALVQLLKAFKNKAGEQLVTGNWLLLASLFFGFAFGGGYMLLQTRPPAGDWWVMYGYWFTLTVYGLGLGVVSSGVYQVGKEVIEKALATFIVKL